MRILSYIVLFYIFVVNSSDAARILAVLPVPSISHHLVFKPLIHELVRRGHDVTVITPDLFFPKGKAPPNLTEIDVHDISYDVWTKRIVITAPKGTKNQMLTIMRTLAATMVELVDVQLQDDQVQQLLRDKTKNFDLLLLEACAKPALGYSYMYKAPVIQVSSFGATTDNYATIGAPVHPFLYPAVTRQRLYNLTLWEKITEFYLNYKVNQIYADTQTEENTMLRKHFGPHIPPMAELNNNVDMIFFNVHPVFEGIRPVPPGVVYMGGLHIKAGKELPTDLKSYLESSKNGVIYISFGTNVDTTLLPADKIKIFVQTLSQLPYDILWKWNNDELPGCTDNIRISKWLPQSDLLRHPKVKLFVTHGGLQSTDEAIAGGVPLVGIPMYGDQYYNVEKYQFFKIGVGLHLESLTVERFKAAINTVISDKSFRQNIIDLRSVMRDEMQSPLERAMWWTEYVLRHGGARHLRAPAANISWAQYLELELVLTLLLGFIATVTILIVVPQLIYKYVYVSVVKFKRT